MATKDVGVVTAYGYAKEKGYTGTEDEFGELLAGVKTLHDEAQTAKEGADNANTSAKSYAVGGTKSRNGEDTDNSKYYSEQSKASADAAKKSQDAAAISVTDANAARTDLQKTVDTATATNTTLGKTNSTAVDTNTTLGKTVTDANAANSTLTKTKEDAATQQSSLSEATTKASNTQSSLESATKTSNIALQGLEAENASAKSNLAELQSENFNSQEILSGVADVRGYLGLYDSDVVGVQVDYKNSKYERLCAAKGLTGGTDFDQFPMFGGRRRCNVADDGTINAYYGDANYKEDGSNGQVMVYQPAFWYLVAPIEYDRQDTGIGYHLRKANYYVSGKARAGFRLHPAFFDKNGNEVDHIFLSAFEASVYDKSASAYLKLDEQVCDPTADLLCSIAGVKPASGYTQNYTRTSTEQMAQNRGDGWHTDLIKVESMNQLLMLIEYAGNLQTLIENGNTNFPWAGLAGDNNSSYAVDNGGTSSLGNVTGHADTSTQHINGQTLTNNTNGKRSITYRGVENPWGNLWKFVYGINIWGNGQMAGGEPYICKDFAFAENKNSDNYIGAGFTVTPKEGYISAMGYSTNCDWLFIASETNGNSSLPIGDYTYVTQNLNGYRIARLGGGWSYGVNAGAFCWSLDGSVGNRYRTFGARLVYIPTPIAVAA